MKSLSLLLLLLVFLAPGWRLQAEDPPSQARTLIPAAAILDLFTKPAAELRAIGVFEAPKITTQIWFQTDSVELADEFSKVQLKVVGLALQDPRLAPYSFSVEGHTDARGSDAYNMRLSQRRSEEIKRRLMQEYGIAESRLLPNGRGEFDLLDPGETVQAHDKNRRVVFVRE